MERRLGIQLEKLLQINGDKVGVHIEKEQPLIIEIKHLFLEILRALSYMWQSQIDDDVVVAIVKWTQ